MKVINLDKFQIAQKVSIGGVEYTINGVTVGKFIDEGDFAEKLEKEPNAKAQMRLMVAELGKLSDIPEAVLKSLSFKALHALIAISNGNFKEDEDDEKEQAPEKQKKE